MPQWVCGQFSREAIMNLHEQCLLKYLMNSVSLENTTDVLLRCNRLIEKKTQIKDVGLGNNKRQ